MVDNRLRTQLVVLVNGLLLAELKAFSLAGRKVVVAGGGHGGVERSKFELSDSTTKNIWTCCANCTQKPNSLIEMSVSHRRISLLHLNVDIEDAVLYPRVDSYIADSGNNQSGKSTFSLDDQGRLFLMEFIAA